MSVVARYAFLLVALAYEVFLGNAAGQAIQNGDFEDVTIGSESSSMPSDVPGWTHSGSVGDHLLWRTGYSDPDGSVVRAGRGAQFVTLGGGYWARGSASWSTTISGLRPGRWYELSFMISNENQRKEPLTLSVSFPRPLLPPGLSVLKPAPAIGARGSSKNRPFGLRRRPL